MRRPINAWFLVGGLMVIGLVIVTVSLLFNPARRMERVFDSPLPADHQVVETFGGHFPGESYSLVLRCSRKEADRFARQPAIERLQDIDIDQLSWMVHLKSYNDLKQSIVLSKTRFEWDQSFRSVLISDGQDPYIFLHWGSSH